MIAGTVADFRRAVDTSKGDGLSSVGRFEDAVGKLPDDRLGSFWMDTQRLADLAAASSGDPSAGAILQSSFKGLGALTGFAQATEDTATFETRLTAGDGAAGKLQKAAARSAPDLMRSLPGDAWAAFAIGDVGESIRTGIQSVAGGLGGALLGGQLTQQLGIDLDRDVLSWVGDAGIFVTGRAADRLGGGVVIKATDADKAAAALPRLVVAAHAQGGISFRNASIAGADQAYAADLPDGPGPVVLARAGDRVVLAVGDGVAQDALEPSSTLGDSGVYDKAKSALDDVDPVLILDGPTAIGLLAQSAGSDPGFAKAKPYLDLLDVLTAGYATDGDTIRQRLTAKVK